MRLYPIEVPQIVMMAKVAADDLGFDLRPQGNPAGAEAGLLALAGILVLDDLTSEEH